jgi:leucyl aminopeptidase
VVLKYTANESEDSKIALVGKGLTFDTGGLNLKPTGNIEDMYLDKSGACAVLGTLRWAVETNFPVNLVCTLALAENAISSKSYKPLDIVTSLKGKTVEIGNTDCEGRLCLADALTYTQANYKPNTVIDLATLTGACVVALGEETAGAFGNSDLIARLCKAGKYYQEDIWELPICKEHEEAIKGKVADICNKGKSRYGGASTAAAFLRHFVEKDVEWAHLDIAGPAMNKAQRGQFSPGGTGFGVQLLTRFLIEEEAEKKRKLNKGK